MMDPEEELGDLEPSLHEELTSAFEAAVTGEGVDTPPAASQGAAPAETPEVAAQRVRDEQGRFAKPGDPVQTPNSSSANPQAQGGPQTGTIAPPASWSATAKAEFVKAHPAIQQEVLKREGDIAAGKAQWDQKAEAYNRLDAILAPRRERFQLAGLDDTRAIQTLFAAQDFLERDPVNAIAYLARQAGVDLRRFGAQGAPGQAAQPPMPPHLQALFQEVNTLKSTLAQQHQQAQQVTQSEFSAQVKAFADDPKNVYFANVLPDMTVLLKSGQAQTLQEAYERATWANPETRALLIKDQRQTSAAEQEQARRAKANAARLASGSVTGSPAPGSSSASGGPAPSLRDELERAFSSAA